METPRLYKRGNYKLYSTTKIKSIKKIGVRETYDLKVYPHRNFFLSNGILSHNSGKSLLAQQMAYYLDPTFNIDRVCMTGQDFLNKLNSSKKYQAIILDEAYKDLDSAQAQRRMQGVLKHAMAEMGQKNLFVFVVLPSFFELSKYVAVHRSIALLHVYTGKNLERGYFTFYGKKKKQRMYVRGKKYMSYCEKADFFGRFGKGYIVDRAAYEKKKLNALTVFDDNVAETVGDMKLLKMVGGAYRFLEQLSLPKTTIFDIMNIPKGGRAFNEIPDWIEASKKFEEKKFGRAKDFSVQIPLLLDKIYKKQKRCIYCSSKVNDIICKKCTIAAARTNQPKLIISEEEMQLLIDAYPNLDHKENPVEYQRQTTKKYELKKKLEKYNEAVKDYQEVYKNVKAIKETSKAKDIEDRMELKEKRDEEIRNLKMSGGYVRKVDPESDAKEEEELFEGTGYDKGL